MHAGLALEGLEVVPVDGLGWVMVAGGIGVAVMWGDSCAWVFESVIGGSGGYFCNAFMWKS